MLVSDVMTVDDQEEARQGRSFVWVPAVGDEDDADDEDDDDVSLVMVRLVMMLIMLLLPLVMMIMVMLRRLLTEWGSVDEDQSRLLPFRCHDEESRQKTSVSGFLSKCWWLWKWCDSPADGDDDYDHADDDDDDDAHDTTAEDDL